MKIHHLGIRCKCYKFIENLYLSLKAFVRVNGQLSKSFSIKKGVRVVPSHQFYLIYLLMSFLINVINMESLLIINVVVEFFLRMTFYYVLQQDLNLRSC